MKKLDLKEGDRVILSGPVGYKRWKETVVQRANPNCCHVPHGAFSQGTIQPDPNRIFTVSFDAEDNVVLTADKPFLRGGVTSIQMKWCHQLDWASSVVNVTPILEGTAPSPDVIDLDYFTELCVEYKRVKDEILQTLKTYADAKA